MNEQVIERKLKKEIENRGGMALKFVSPGKAGVPDRLVLLPGGKAVFVELKAPGRKLRPLQIKRAKDLKKLGFPVYVVSEQVELDGLIQEIFPQEFSI